MKILGNNKGISLLEVLISMLVSTIGILGLAPMIVLSIDSNSISSDVMKAANLAKEKIELYEAMDSLPALPFAEQEPNLSEGFYRSTEITENAADTSLPAGMCCLLVTVSWTDKTGESRSTSYSTILDKG